MVSICGGLGHNNPCDLYGTFKNSFERQDSIKGLRENKTEQATTLGKCTDSFDKILTNFDETFKVHHSADFHTVPSSDNDVKLIVSDLSETVKILLKEVTRTLILQDLS